MSPPGRPKGEYRSAQREGSSVSPPNLATVEIKAFVPARDFELSKRFYEALGFTIPWSDDKLAYLHFGETSFLLQKFYVREHADNFMMHMLVEDADAWHRHVVDADIPGRFGVRLGEIGDRPWAMRDFSLQDPTGVLWLIAHNLPKSN